MKKHLSIFIGIKLFLLNSISAQNIYPLKEHYDKLYPIYTYDPNASDDHGNCYLTGNLLPWTLSSLLRTYQATGDKSYLIKFINHCLTLQQVRKDVINPTNAPVWVRFDDYACDVPPSETPNANDDEEPAYFNSLLLYPMAEFINMVINEPNHQLYNTNLPLQLINNLPSSPTILGYGDFANWLGKKVEESIFYMNDNYWDDSFGIKGHFTDECDGSDFQVCGTAMNWNSPYGATLLYMGLTNTNFGYGNNRASYLDKAQTIAELYNGNINLVDLCTCNLTGCESYNEEVLRLMANGNNSYFWFHSGWSIFKDNCFLHPFDPQPRIDRYIEHFEDVSHGAMDLWFVKACYEAQLSPCTTCPPYFTSIEMERFRNTLTKNIYYTNNTGGHFHNTVNGLDNGFAGDDDCNPNCPTDLMWGEVLTWMPVYKFDGNSSPNAYDILLNHTVGLVQDPSTQNLSGAQSFLGLAEVIRAQWDKECINLTLYNREMVYDQDFFVKNNLVVAPELDDDFHDLGGNSFADPIIQDNTFIIPANVKVNMVAGESISLLPGFSAQAGSFLSASINPSQCTDGQIVGDPETKSLMEDESSDVTASINESELKISPNPFTNTVTIHFNLPFAAEVSILIYDNLGNVCYNEITNRKIEAGSFSIPVSTEKWANGIYHCILITDGSAIKTSKLIKTD